MEMREGMKRIIRLSWSSFQRKMPAMLAVRSEIVVGEEVTRPAFDRHSGLRPNGGEGSQSRIRLTRSRSRH
jgi:hypothetical protein